MINPSENSRKLLNWTGSGLTAALVVIFGGTIAGLMRVEIPEKNHDIILILITTGANALLAVVSYFFGSSSSTRTKDDTIAAQASTIATTVPAVTPTADKTINLDPGQTASVNATDPKP